MTAPVRPVREWTLTRLIAVAATFAVVIVGFVLAFATVHNPTHWIATGFIAAGIALALLIGFV